jgi:hypothetical protein
MHIKSIIQHCYAFPKKTKKYLSQYVGNNNSIAMLSLKTWYPVRIWTRVFCSVDRWDVQCVTPSFWGACLASKIFLKYFCGQCLYFSFQLTNNAFKSIYTEQYCYFSYKPIYPGGIQTRVFSFLRCMRCPLRHAARASSRKYCSLASLEPETLDCLSSLVLGIDWYVWGWFSESPMVLRTGLTNNSPINGDIFYRRRYNLHF